MAEKLYDLIIFFLTDVKRGFPFCYIRTLLLSDYARSAF